MSRSGSGLAFLPLLPIDGEAVGEADSSTFLATATDLAVRSIALLMECPAPLTDLVFKVNCENF